MMQAPNLWNLHDPARVGELDGPDVRRILVECEMRASSVIVRDVAGQDATQVVFAEDENMIPTLAPDRTDEPLREGILPRAVRGREDFLDPQALYSVPKRLAVNAVTVAQEIRRRGVVREGFHDLLSGPLGGISALIGGRPPVGRPESSISTRGSDAAASAGRYRGSPPNRKGRSGSRWSRSVIIGPKFSPGRDQQINHLRAGRGFWRRTGPTRDAPAPRRVLPNAPRVTRCSCG